MENNEDKGAAGGAHSGAGVEQGSVMENEIINRSCACGCGGFITWNEPRKRWNRYIYGHNMKGKHQTAIHKERISKAQIGSKKSEEHKEKVRQALLGKPQSAEKRMGTKIAMNRPEVKEKLRAYRGENHWNWQGGDLDSYSQDWTNDLRDAIRKRDKYACQMCGLTQDKLCGWNNKHDIHHIDYDKENCDPKNLITLCRPCHVKTNYKREAWRAGFETPAEIGWAAVMLS